MFSSAMMAILATVIPSSGRDARRIAVVPIVAGSDGRSESPTSIASDVRSELSFRPMWEIVGLEYDVLSSGDPFSDVVACEHDRACIADRLRAEGADVVLLIVVNRLAQPALVSIQAIEARTRSVIGEIIAPVRAEESDISSAIRTRAKKILDELGGPALGRIVVETRSPGAVISVDSSEGAALGTDSFWVPPGRHRVTVSSPGFATAHAEVEASSGKETRISISLDPLPSIVESPWLWGVIGAIVAGGVSAAIVLTRPVDHCYCFGRGGQNCC